MSASVHESTSVASTVVTRGPFVTSVRYHDRESKPLYVVDKYMPLLRGRVLDVGADGAQMARALPSDCEYTGIGIGAPPTLPVDLEAQGVPYSSDTFDCVLCLDVLEHVDNPHQLFDELCRVSRGFVVVSLPNCWAAFWGMLRHGPYRPGRALKFYGLPPEAPGDRHKWFFHIGEAEEFIRSRSARCNAEVVQIDYEGQENLTAWQCELEALQRAGIVHESIDARALFAGAMWAVIDVRSAGHACTRRE
ncbi:MAG: class I SAM-dependent methyltransferase [Planctomycetes bacterium]|nr:class I SAM-dependent methyltransferase [Planctomycetota bacterium]